MLREEHNQSPLRDCLFGLGIGILFLIPLYLFAQYLLCAAPGNANCHLEFLRS